MNPEILLTHFDRLCEAPDAIPRLRRFILDLAVRGKLVEQYQNEEAPFIGTMLDIKLGEKEFGQPSHWIRAKIGDLLDFQYGKPYSASERLDQGRVSIFGSNGVVGYCDVALTENAAIIIGRKGSAGALNLSMAPSWTTDVAYFVEPPPFFDIHFLLITLQTLDLAELGKGVKPGLSRSDAYRLEIPIPPIAEQRRIVAKVDELMALCDRLEAAQAEREWQRDRLAGASLQRMNQTDDDAPTFRAHFHFYLRHFPRLTTRPEQIHQLRQTILNLAVQGKLVPQDPTDVPAQVILDQIQVEKNRLVKEGMRKEEKRLILIDTDEVPFELPEGWTSCKIDSLVCSLKYDIRTGPFGSSLHKHDHKSEGVPVWGIESINKNGTFCGINKIFVDADKARDLSAFAVKGGDIIISRSGTVGDLCRLPDDVPYGLISTNLMKISLDGRVIAPDYFYLLFKGTRSIDAQLSELCSGSTRLFLTQTILTRLLFPLPPLTEQRRIVAKVDELMALCDWMETRLRAANTDSRRLLGAVLHKALN